MSTEDIEVEYIEWLHSIADPSRSYRKLFDYLFSVEYEHEHPLDSNLEWAGLQLRNTFFKEKNIDELTDIFGTSCTVLEFLVAVAKDISDNYTAIRGDCDRTSCRFYDILEHLGMNLAFDEGFENWDRDLNFLKIHAKTGHFYFWQKFIYERFLNLKP